NRTGALGIAGSQAFERAVSCAASIGLVLGQAGFQITLATGDAAPRQVSEGTLLDFLAGVTQARIAGVADVLTRLRSAGPPDSTIAVVAALPSPPEIAMLARVGMALGRKLAVIVARVAAAIAVAPAALLERRSIVLAALVSAAALILTASLMVFPATTRYGLPMLETFRQMGTALGAVGRDAAAQVAPALPVAPLFLAS